MNVKCTQGQYWGEGEELLTLFVNLCLRVWMQMMIEETDLFAD